MTDKDKKMTTGGFFRSLFKFAISGEGENPIETVVKKGIEHGKAQEEPKVIETSSEEVQIPEASCGDSDDGGARKGTKAS